MKHLLSIYQLTEAINIFNEKPDGIPSVKSARYPYTYIQNDRQKDDHII